MSDPQAEKIGYEMYHVSETNLYMLWKSNISPKVEEQLATCRCSFWVAILFIMAMQLR